MRKTAKALSLVVVSFLAAIVLAVGSAFGAALAFGATALIVPGTGTPNATNVAGYMQNARDYYMGGTACANGGCTDADLHSIVYPASFFPLSFIPNWCVTGRCEKWDASVQTGVENLDLQLKQALQVPDEQIVIFGYSQGGAVVTNELLNLRGALSDADKARIEVVVIGNVDNPAGGLFTRLGFLGRVPFFDVATGIATPIDTGLPITSIRFEYDGVSDSPKYFGNLLAVANAVAGFAYIHGTYLDPNQNGQFVGLPNDYTAAQLSALINDPANATFDAANDKYVLVPTKTLPIVRPFLDLATSTGTTALVKPVIDLISPVLRVLIDLGYDRSENPGVNSPLSILPFSPTINPIQVGLDLIAAVIQGIEDAAAGGSVSVAPPTTTTALAASAPQARTSLVQSGGAEDESAKRDNVVALPVVADRTPTPPVVDDATTLVTEVAVTKPVESTKPVETTKPVATPTDEPEKDEPEKDEPKQDEPKQDEPKQDAPKQDAPKQDAPKQDAPNEKAAA